MSEQPDFAYSDAIFALGALEPEDFTRLIRSSVEEGKLVRMLQGKLADAEKPLDGFMLAWPSTEAGLLSLVIVEDGHNEFQGCWPFANSGIAHPVTVNHIHRDEDCAAIAMLEGQIGHVPITVFDTFCDSLSGEVAPGDTVILRLHAWAVSLRRASQEPVRIKLADIVNSKTREIFRASGSKDGVVEIGTKGMVAFLPSAPCSPLHELRAPIRSVRVCEILPGMPVWVLTVLFMRDHDDQGREMELRVTGAVWDGAAPEVGDDVEGIIWVQASR